MDAGRVESLREQIAVQAAHDSGFHERHVAQSPTECLRDQFVFVQILKDLGDGVAREFAGDTKCFDLA